MNMPPPNSSEVDVAADPDFTKYVAHVRCSARRSLLILGEAGGELSISLVDDAAMQRLNATWRGRDQSTDVLAFAQREGEEMGSAELLGDVVISVPTARRQADERGHSLFCELDELLVHGILHLLGYDHERSASEAKRMFTRQTQVLECLAVPEDAVG